MTSSSLPILLAHGLLAESDDSMTADMSAARRENGEPRVGVGGPGGFARLRWAGRYATCLRFSTTFDFSNVSTPAPKTREPPRAADTAEEHAAGRVDGGETGVRPGSRR
jgi:hypothetical protein